MSFAVFLSLRGKTTCSPTFHWFVMMVMGGGCGSDSDDSVAVSELVYFLFYHQACALFQVLQINGDRNLFNIVLC
jgi:hypothetical protein